MYRTGKRAVWALLALLSFGAGWVLAWHHPVWPVAALVFFYVAFIAIACWPGIWLLVVPAGLPWLNFSPWTGWLIFDEFDLLLLAVFAGAYTRLAWSVGNSGAEQKRGGNQACRRAAEISDLTFLALVAALGVLGFVGLWRGFRDAGGFTFGWFQGYTDPLNSLRVFKSLLLGILTVPLLRHAMRLSTKRAGNRLALGMLLGLATVSLAALWERAAYPGVFDFSSVYRITALFWEMHVGGGALDGYLALAMPFVLWALLSARKPAHWVSAAAVALLAAYTCLMTFSRSVYLVEALTLLVSALLWRIRAPSSNTSGVLRTRPGGSASRPGITAVWCLGLVVTGLVGAVLFGGTWGMVRLDRTDRDLSGRKVHWLYGLGLLGSPADWVLGLGLGRLPANYANRVPPGAGEFSGRVQMHAPRQDAAQVAPTRQYVTVWGPASNPDLGGLFALTQRVDIHAGERYRVSLDVRATVATRVAVQLCERHLLYDWHCQDALIRVENHAGEWQHRVAQLAGDDLSAGPWYAPRLAMLTISVLDGAAADFYSVSLTTADRRELLSNGDFSSGLARWFPAAQFYFLPWHIDNLYLEVLIERGIAGLLVFAGLVVWTLARLLSGAGETPLLSICLAASLLGALLIGVFSSLMDVPRVAFLLFFLVFFAWHLSDRREPREPS